MQVELRDLLQTSFQDLEIMLFQELAAQYLIGLQQVLSMLDELLLADRDHARYLVKDRRVRAVETLFGTLQFKRRYYQDQQTGAYIALLDETLGLAKQVQLSPGLSEAAIWQGVNGPSYRAAQRTLAAFYHRPVISHEAVRQQVLQAGQLIMREEQRRQQTVVGDRRVPILFIEADGLYSHLQRDAKQGVEQQLAVSHEGWQRRSAHSREYQLVNRHYQVAAPGEDFWEAASRQLYSRYDLEGAVVVINGDRAEWIQKGTDYFADAAAVLFQWDRFHLARDLRRLLRQQPQLRQTALRALRQSQSNRLLGVLATAEGRETDPQLKREIRVLKEAVLANRKRCATIGFGSGNRVFSSRGYVVWGRPRPTWIDLPTDSRNGVKVGGVWGCKLSPRPWPSIWRGNYVPTPSRWRDSGHNGTNCHSYCQGPLA